MELNSAMTKEAQDGDHWDAGELRVGGYLDAYAGGRRRQDIEDAGVRGKWRLDVTTGRHRVQRKG